MVMEGFDRRYLRRDNSCEPVVDVIYVTVYSHLGLSHVKMLLERTSPPKQWQETVHRAVLFPV